MKTTLQELDDKYLVTFEGDLDTAAAVEVDQILKPLYTSKGKDIEIECKKLQYISSSGLRILSRIIKGVRAAGNKATMKDVKDDIMRVLRLTGLVSLFEFE